MKKENIKDMSVAELNKKVASLKKELFDLKLSVASTHVKDNSQFRKLRAEIARTLTYIGQKERGQD